MVWGGSVIREKNVGWVATFVSGSMLISDGIMKDSKNNNGVFSIGYNTQKASVTVVSGSIVSWGCSAVGAKIGAFVGTAICPGVGTAIGAPVGGVGGSILGNELGVNIGLKMFDEIKK